jgi:hypothetical protein
MSPYVAGCKLAVVLPVAQTCLITGNRAHQSVGNTFTLCQCKSPQGQGQLWCW